jgi:hypothetical protein
MKNKNQLRLATLSLSLLSLLASPRAARAWEPNIGNFSIAKADFAETYNTIRFAQPKNVPWAGSYWAYGRDGIAVIPSGQSESPAERFDRQFKLGTQTVDFEREQHTCSNLPDEQKAGCQGWWGHCNAWAAAAIKDPEPVKKVKLGSAEFSVADQKAYLTEMWMETGSLFAGATNKSLKTDESWVSDPKSKEGSKINSSGLSNYDSFWDVTPKNFFLLVTNYIGMMKVGVVIDRFSGEEVWNQPLSGYRILPLRDSDLGSETKDGATVYYARVRMKIYWANDGVPHGAISSKFKIENTTDDESADYFPEDDYTARLIRFKLFFDAPVTVSHGKVTSAGRMIGKGIWHMQEFPPSDPVWYNHSHPDFVWMPTQLHGATGYGNPALTASRVYQVTKAATQVTPPVDDEPEVVTPSPVPPTTVTPPASHTGPEGEVTPQGTRHIVKVLLSSFEEHDRVYMKGKIFRTLRRAEIHSIMSSSDLKIVGDHVEQPAIYPANESLEKIRAALDEAGYKTID